MIENGNLPLIRGEQNNLKPPPRLLFGGSQEVKVENSETLIFEATNGNKQLLCWISLFLARGEFHVFRRGWLNGCKVHRDKGVGYRNTKCHGPPKPTF